MINPQGPDTSPARVLIFPCGSEIGLEIHRALAGSTHIELLLGASSIANHHGKYVFANYVEGLPQVDMPEFIPALNALIERERIGYIMPAHDSVVLELAQRQPELNAVAVTSPVETCGVCRRKSLTYQVLAGTVRTPRLFDPAQTDLPFPLFLKPDVGQGSRGVAMVHNAQELRVFLDRDPSLLTLEYLPGAEYTVDCFTDRERQLLFVGARERVRTLNGISVNTHPVDDPEFATAAKAINERLVLRGAWFFQMKRAADGGLALLEVAPRVSGAMGLYRNLGVNLPLLSLFDRMERPVSILHQKGLTGEMDRALYGRFRLDIDYKRVYMDLDDTLIVNGHVHLPTLAFIYQCRNKNIPVHLVTRHLGNVRKYLKKFGLRTHVFQRIHRLKLGERKSKCMTRNAIYIDDSFAERKDVHEALQIPVFGLDAIESLMDWRA